MLVIQQICEETSVNNDGFDSTEVSISDIFQYITLINRINTGQFSSHVSYGRQIRKSSFIQDFDIVFLFLNVVKAYDSCPVYTS